MSGRIEADQNLRDADAELQRATRGVLTALATDALTIGEGGQLPISTHYREQFRVGTGTVQRALEVLINAGALQITSRGHLGRQIRRLDVARLWHLGALGPVRLLLPPRGPIEVRAFAEVFSDEFQRIDVPAQFRHVPGGPERERMLLSGEADIAVVSSGVDLESHPSMTTIRLPDHTYYAEGRVYVLRSPDPARGNRIAIDYSSTDQTRLTRAEFPDGLGYEYVEVDFPRIPLAILQGKVDVGLWHDVQTLIPPHVAGLEVGELQRPESIAILKTSSAANVVTSPLRSELASVMPLLELEGIMQRQQELLALPEDDPKLLDFGWVV